MAKIISKDDLKRIETTTDEFLTKVEDDIENKKYIKRWQFAKYLIKELFGDCIDEMFSNQCVNKQVFQDLSFCVGVYLRHLSINLKSKTTDEQAKEELIEIIKNYKEVFGARAAEIQTYSLYQGCEIDEFDSMDLARLLTRQCGWAFIYKDGIIQCSLTDSQLSEWIIMHVIEVQ